MNYVTGKMQEIQPYDPRAVFVRDMTERYISLIKSEFESALRYGRHSVSGVLHNSSGDCWLGDYDPAAPRFVFIGLGTNATMADFEKIRENLIIRLRELGFKGIRVEIRTRNWTTVIYKGGIFTGFVKDHKPGACIYVEVSW